MKTKHALALGGLALLSGLTALAQDPDHSWSRTYPVTGKPTLTLETADAGVEFRPCGDCHEVRIHIEVVGRKMSDYRLEEGQSGDEVHFLFKERPHVGGHHGWHTEQTRVTVESPAQLTLRAKTSDGNVTLSGLQGDLSLTTGDGNVAVDHVSGNVRIRSGDGRVNVTDADGSIDAHTSDGDLSVDGSFQALALHTSDGHVDCALPLATDNYQSGGRHGNELHGKLNGGGTPLTINTSDGNVKIEQL